MIPYRRVGSLLRDVTSRPHSSTKPVLNSLRVAGGGELLPGGSHLFELLAVGGRCGTRHLATFRGVLLVLMQFFHAITRPPGPDNIQCA